ncbi:MAG TPA: UDP-N-acetylmuramoyl-L-alanyl-D-glutamate--2,6-diaminopimelate ligase [Candidatus Scatovivens faecipullorum]|nr:UDP-N-acetylmuramoyl-L-alanyl-D-glutamate--2,6-diaminopimelate ligase [Candidatus Scatovivens faecipullorum]
MLLNKLISKVEVINKVGDLNLDITNIHSDSRKIKEGGLFIAINGFTKNGIEFIPNAIKNGAKALIVEPDVDINSLNISKNIPIISVSNTRRALAQVACEFYDNPSKKLKLIGITGTKGKTTTTFMVKSILEAHGLNVGLIGSIAVYINNEKIEDTDRTTPESIEIQKHLATMVKKNVDVAIIEVSSQAMKLERVTGCDFEIALFTNLSEDHISPKEHPNMEDYFNCKLNLIKMARNGVINNDDKIVSTIKSLLPDKNIKTFAIDNPADFKVNPESVVITDSYIDFSILLNGKEEKIEACIPGRFSIYNAAGAIAVSSHFGVTADEIRLALKDLKVLGRSELVPNKLGITIMIDYAHTPSSLESILTAVNSYAKGRVICAWGVGGDRDAAKRPIMGEISGRLADYTVLMSDQVRTEDPVKILKEIEVGIIPTGKPYKIVVDRTEGIRYAISIAKPGDIIVIPGLGHDLYLERNGVKYPYDERIVIKNIIDEMIKSGERKPIN